MSYYATVTQKGQITLRKKLRERLGIKTYGTVNVSVTDDHIEIKPVPSFLSLAGTFKVRKGVSALRAREEMEKNYKRV